MTSIAAQKMELRRRMKTERAVAHAAAPEAGAQLAKRIRPIAQACRVKAMGGYWPAHSEIDPRPSMLAMGGQLFLPVVRARDTALDYREWREGDHLMQGLAGTMEPGVLAERGRPDCILVPGLAFDVTGFRLGYGGGYYDRTLDLMRSRGKLLAIGVCYDAQLVNDVPHDINDRRVDIIVTPGRLIRTP